MAMTINRPPSKIAVNVRCTLDSFYVRCVYRILWAEDDSTSDSNNGNSNQINITFIHKCDHFCANTSAAILVHESCVCVCCSRTDDSEITLCVSLSVQVDSHTQLLYYRNIFGAHQWIGEATIITVLMNLNDELTMRILWRRRPNTQLL